VRKAEGQRIADGNRWVRKVVEGQQQVPTRPQDTEQLPKRGMRVLHPLEMVLFQGLLYLF